MDTASPFGPWQFRRFAHLADRFFRLWPWLWFGGIAGCLVVALLGLGRPAIVAVCCVTIYPALLGWLGFNGVAILWNLLLGVPTRTARLDSWGRAFFVIRLLIGALFLGGAIALSVALVRLALGA